jgi:T4 RnlA family RNA ligase
MKGIEGFVVGLSNGQRIKIKTDEYLSLHRAKDSIQSNRRLFEVAINGATDDLRSLFHDDQYTLDRIQEMERVAGHAYNHLVKSVEDYHAEHKDLDRKSYANTAKEVLGNKTIAFGCAMQLYTGREPDYKERLIKNFKQFVEDNDE